MGSTASGTLAQRSQPAVQHRVLPSAEKTAAALANLDGTDFQRAVCQMLQLALLDFQSVPDGSGDGGLDGLSQNRTVAYQCYGPHRTTLNKPTVERRKAYRTKFRSDLRRIYELKPAGRDHLEHWDNALLATILTGSPKN
jgi:hypothetical protein